VARVLAAIIPPLVRIGGVVEPHELNDQPGRIFSGHSALEVTPGRGVVIPANPMTDTNHAPPDNQSGWSAIDIRRFSPKS